MEDLAMLRKFLPLCLLLCASFAGAQDLGKLLKSRYEALNNAIIRRDSKAAEQWVAKYCASSFLYTSKDKHRWDRKGFLQGILDQMRLTKKIAKSVVSVGKPSLKGSRLEIVTKSDFEGVVSYDGKDLSLVDKTETKDVWIRSGSDWKLSAVTQTKAETQLFQKGS